VRLWKTVHRMSVSWKQPMHAFRVLLCTLTEPNSPEVIYLGWNGYDNDRMQPITSALHIGSYTLRHNTATWCSTEFRISTA